MNETVRSKLIVLSRPLFIIFKNFDSILFPRVKLSTIVKLYSLFLSKNFAIDEPINPLHK